MKLDAPVLRDSAYFTPQGRRMLASIGAIERDPLLVQAETWLLAHTGPETPASKRVRANLGEPPRQWLDSVQQMRSVK